VADDTILDQATSGFGHPKAGSRVMFDVVVPELTKFAQLGLMVIAICGIILPLVIIFDKIFDTDPED
jgi:hypothetical protein